MQQRLYVRIYVQDEVCMYGLGNGHYVLEIPLGTVSFNPFSE